MFAVLIQAPPAGPLPALYRCFCGKKAKETALPEGAGAYWRAEAGKLARPPWRRLLRQVGPQTPWLLPQGAALPQEGLFLVSPAQFRALLLGTAAAQILTGISLPLYHKTAVLLDKDGSFEALVEQLLPWCMAVKVATASIKGYEALSRRLLVRWGAGLILTPWEKAIPRGTLYLDPWGERLAEFPARAPVLTALPRGRHGGPGQVLCGLEIGPPPGWADILPPGIRTTEFLAACHALGRWRPRYPWRCLRFYCGDHPATLEQIAGYCGREERAKRRNSQPDGF
ncbi:MAG: hypothetical protein PHD67_07290 [Oscillospiraceae bacterium]|nr:hypothetical protein [Oscillospiraceae bacterium]